MSLFSFSAQARTGRSYGLGSIKVQRGERAILYLSLDYVPPWRPVSWLIYRAAVREHIASAGPAAEVFVERPRHPIPFLRRRRRHV